MTTETPSEPSESTAVASMLIVDDDATLRERLAVALRARGFDTRTAANFDEALALAQAESPELAVLDLRMPGNSGLELLRELKRIDPETKIVVLTAYGSIATTIDAMKLGAVYYLQKPADVDDILAAFQHGAADAHPVPNMDFAAPSLERVRWEHINRVLADCEGNISEAARRLQLHRRTLQRMLQKYPPRQ
ncbi:MAG TPA: response regulator [Polyangiales bacterium]